MVRLGRVHFWVRKAAAHISVISDVYHERGPGEEGKGREEGSSTANRRLLVFLKIIIYEAKD